MGLSEISIRRPVFAWMLMLALILFGWLCFQRMGVSQLPDVDYPVVNVGLALEGAAPEVMEVDVVDPIEDALTAIQGIQSMSSSSKTGSANITLEFDLNKNIDVAVQEVQTVLSQVVRKLPKELDPPSVRKTNPEDSPIMWIGVSSPKRSRVELMSLVRDQVKDHFSTLNGVGEITLGGYVEPALRVWLSTKRLEQYSLTVTDILNTISSEHAETPSGRIESSDRELNVRTMGEAPTAEEFGQLNINKRGGGANYVPIALSKVAVVEDGVADVRSVSRANGMSAVGLGIRKQRGSNAVDVAEQVKAKLKDIKAILPEDVEIVVRFDTTKFIQESVHELNFTLILSAFLTAIVCWVFLGSFSATVNVVMAIPTSIIGSFMVLYWLGFTLNTFTLLGLSLAIGIVVDDAIMVLENIVRHKEKGMSRFEAALIGAKEISFAALAATIAIVAIFLPVAFMSGILGKFFLQFGVTLSVAVLISLLEALTLTPMRCSQFLSIGERNTWFGRAVEAGFHKGAEIYARALAFVLRYRVMTIAVSLVFFAGTVLTVKVLKKEFVPSQDQGRLMVRLRGPVGSSLEVMDKKFAEVEAILAKIPDVEGFFGSIGGGDVNTGQVFVTLKPKPQRSISRQTGKPMTHLELISLLRKSLKEVKDLNVNIQDPSLSGFSAKRGFPVEFSVRGPDWNTLVVSSQKLMAAMNESGLMNDVDSDYVAGLPEVRVTPDREKARQSGVSVADIGTTINAMIGGVQAGKFSKNGHRYDVRVRLEPSERSKPTDIERLQVRNNRGELVPLSRVVSLNEVKSLQSISRQDRERAITVFANVGDHTSQEQALDAVQVMAKKILPDGYHTVISGSAKTYKESFQSLILALILGLIVSYMVLASQFNSFIDPVTVLMALPFSASGAFLALFVGGQSLNIYSMIGLVLLMGIVKKNSILLVDFTNQVRDEGLDVKAALLRACPIRLRPILMTSFATIAGAVPAALSFGPGAESRVPMALAVIGGVFVSTLLTLFVVPCCYSLLARRRFSVTVKEHEAPHLVRSPV